MPPTQRRSAADHDPRRCPIVGNGIEDFALVLQARIDDLDRRHDIFSGAQHIGQADAGAAQRVAEDESQFDFNPRQAIILVGNARAVGDHHVVEQISEIRLVDL